MTPDAVHIELAAASPSPEARAYQRLAQLAIELGSARDLPAVYSTLRRFVAGQAPICGLFISRYDPVPQLRTCVYAWSEGEELDPTTFPPMPNTGSPHSRAIETGEIVLTQDFQEEMAGKPRVNVGLEKDPRLPQSSLCVPLLSAGRALGAIEMQSTQPKAFRPEHIDALRLAAQLATLAIEGVQALEREKRAGHESARRAAELEALMADRVRELAAKNRELEAFSFTAAHDLRAPLRAILGLTDALLRGERDRLTPRGAETLEAIHQSGDRMARLVEDLLKFARTSQGNVRREILDMTQLVRLTIAELQQREPERPTRIEVQPNLFVDADATLLPILLDNILGNAWKYSSKKPVTAITVGARIERGEIVYFVRDEGIGLAPGAADRIFLAFERMTANEYEGTGLGLATAQRIVQRHGGRIWAEGEPGVGTTIHFTLAPPRRPDAPT